MAISGSHTCRCTRLAAYARSRVSHTTSPSSSATGTAAGHASPIRTSARLTPSWSVVSVAPRGPRNSTRPGPTSPVGRAGVAASMPRTAAGPGSRRSAAAWHSRVWRNMRPLKKSRYCSRSSSSPARSSSGSGEASISNTSASARKRRPWRAAWAAKSANRTASWCGASSSWNSAGSPCCSARSATRRISSPSGRASAIAASSARARVIRSSGSPTSRRCQRSIWRVISRRWPPGSTS